MFSQRSIISDHDYGDEIASNLCPGFANKPLQNHDCNFKAMINFFFE